MAVGSFVFPDFWNYPPYFTLQPIPNTQTKQKEIWRSFILDYCRHYRIFQIDVDDPTPAPPFANPAINRRLNREAKVAFLDDIATNGRGFWVDSRTKRTFVVLWKSLEEWADGMYAWAVDHGFKDCVVTVDEVLRGSGVYGTDLQDLPRVIFDRALKILETQGKAKLFSGATPDEEGIKFF